MLTTAAVAAWRPSVASGALLGLFVGAQLGRARLEERKLLKSFPEYGARGPIGWWFWRL